MHAPLTPAAYSLMTFKLSPGQSHTFNQAHTPQKNRQSLPVRCPLLLFAGYVAVCLRVRVYFVVGGNPCLLILSSHCSQWLTRDNHVLFSRVVFLGRSCWALPFFELKPFLLWRFGCPIGFDISLFHFFS